MTQLVSGSHTVCHQGDIVVFVVGARINKWWLLPMSLPILSRMGAMLRELSRDPDSGFLGSQSLGLGGMLQYWRSVDDLLRYADARDRHHRPAAKNFLRRVFANQAVGVWHELYAVPAGHFEALYLNMPRFGVGRVFPPTPARGELAKSRGRLSAAALAIGRSQVGAAAV